MELIPDLNEKLEECCEHPNYFFDKNQAEIVCLNCASVVGDYYRMDERLFENTEKAKHNEIFSKHFTTLNYKHLKGLEYSDFKKWRRLTRLNSQVHTSTSFCFNYFDLLLNTYENVPENIQFDAKTLITKSLDNNISSGRSLESMVESSIYMAFELNNVKIDYKSFFKSFKIECSTKKLRTFKYYFDYFKNNFIKKSGKKNPFPVVLSDLDVKKYLINLCNNFKASDEVKSNLIRAADSNIFELPLFSGKSMAGIACGLFYYQCRKNKNNIIMKDICGFAGYSEVTARNNFRDLCMLKLKYELNSGKEPSKELAQEAFMTKNKGKIIFNLKMMISEYPKLRDKLKQILSSY